MLKRIARCSVIRYRPLAVLAISYDNALAETINGLYKTEVIRQQERLGGNIRKRWSLCEPLTWVDCLQQPTVYVETDW